MTLGEQFRWWGAGFATFVVVLWLLSDAVLPFVLGAALAYLTDPLADRLERAGLSRLLATAVITTLSLGVAVLALVLIIPTLIDQVQNAIASAPSYVEWLRGIVTAYMPSLSDDDSALRGAMESLRNRAEGWSVSVLQGLWSGGLAVIDFAALVVITPVVAFYLLYDWDRMITGIDASLPRQHRATIHRLMGELDRVLAGFVRGQLSVCAILGAFYAVALSLIGLQFGLLIGAFAGLISFIPFVGSILGGLVSIGVAVVQFWDEPVMIAAVAAVFVAGQAVEGNILTPKLVGGKVGLHPVWLMFALSAFGSLFGFVGLLVAVPAAASIGVFGRFLIERYKDGQLYRGSVEWRERAAAESRRTDEGRE
ncbi:MAG: AI-2E family transporter [Alphaproteobacteria bacterium]